VIALGVVVVCGVAVWVFIKACSDVTHSICEERDDHELALSAQRARIRLANEERAALAAVLAVRTAEPRDPTIGVDQARAEVRARIHRYNNREVRHGDR